MEDEQNLEFTAELIESSIHTKSSKCSAILGYFAAIIRTETKELEYKDYVVMNVLKTMIDKDVIYQ